MDVSLYNPEELKVVIAEDRLIVNGKHEQKADNHGYVSREFKREFVIPEVSYDIIVIYKDNTELITNLLSTG